MSETSPQSPLKTPLYVGTMGWNYEDWTGVFYPAGTPLRESLPYYAQTFDAVEIDSTFYGTPRESQVKRWRDTTPPHFVFCPKAPRLITHDALLNDVEEPLTQFLHTMQHLEGKLGAILFQMPPSFTRADLPALEALLPRLAEIAPPTQRFAMEFRHRSLIGKDVSDLLRESKVALTAADYYGMPRRFEPTADFAYVRLIGRHGAYESHRNTQAERTPEVQRWAETLRTNQDRFERIFVFCNNDYEGYSPTTCNRLRALLGQTPRANPKTAQTSLFDEF